MSKIRVLVMEDSLTVRKHLVAVLSSDAQFEVVGEATNGREGIELCQRLRPDVVTADIVMPVMSGLAAIEYIMAYCPTPILIISSSCNRGEVFKTLDALAAGAADVLDKPPGEIDNSDWERHFLQTVRIVSRIKVISHPAAKLRPKRVRPEPPVASPHAMSRAGGYELVAIGASTGGPAALMQLLPGLSAGFPLPILMVVHLDRRFDQAFAEWLQALTPLPIRMASDGMPLPQRGAGCILVAPADYHLVVDRRHLQLVSAPERNFCRPSVDVLFESLAIDAGPRAIACLLSGMGSDGARGMLALRHAGAMTLVQDEATSVIFGMPKAAVDIGAATRVLALPEFAPSLNELSEEGWENTSSAARPRVSADE